MGFREPQTPGIGGLEELTSTEETAIGEIADITHAKGKIIVSNGTIWSSLGVGANDTVLTADSTQSVGIKWSATAGTGDVSGTTSVDNAVVRWNGTAGTNIQSSGIDLDDSNNLYPRTNDSGGLGLSGSAWADLFLASGAVINFAAGDATITHSSNTLKFEGASSGYQFDALAAPATDDGAPLGSTSLKWSDVFLASGAVINFNSGDITITHQPNLLAFAGAGTAYTFDAPLRPNTNDATSLGSSGSAWADLFLAAGGTIDFNAGDVTITHEANILRLVGATSGYTVDAVFSPVSNDGAPLGSTGTSWSDLFLASGAVVNFAAGDVTITHSSNKLDVDGGVVDFGSTPTVNDAAIYFVGGTDVALADGGTGASLVDPGADRFIFWDDSASTVDWLVAGNGLTITGTTIVVDSASLTVDGIVEIATAAETTAGTDATRAVSPDGLAGSDYGKRVIEMMITGTATATTTGSAMVFFRTPSVMNNWQLVGAAACVYLAGTTNVLNVMVRNMGNVSSAGTAMLSTALTIDSAEVDSLTAQTAVVISATGSAVLTGDRIMVDVNAVHGSAASGLVVELQFQAI